MTDSEHSAGATGTHERPAFPISVIMECRQVSRGNWSWPEWRVHAVVAPQSPTRGLKVNRIDADKSVDRYLCTGLSVGFHHDAAENYWHNLKGRQPSLFVVCRPRDTGESGSIMVPFLVTVDQYEAEAYLEGDDAVFAVPIPADVYAQLERFVMDHYRPEQQRKRKRNRWNDRRGQKPSQRH